MIKMAIRNMLRNKKRSMLTIFAIVIAILGATVLQGWIRGAGDMMTEEGKRVSGEIRITSLDYELKSKSLDVSSNIDYEEVSSLVEDLGYKSTNLGRIKFGALAFLGEEDEKAIGFGIEEEDYEIIGFEHFIYEGRFIDFTNEGEIIVGKKIKDKLNLQLGDLITVVSSTQYGSMSAFNYEVVGFYKMDNSHMNKSVYMSLEDAQYHLDMEGAVTEYLMFLDNDSNIPKVYENLKDNEDYLVLPWDKIGLNEYMAKALPIFNLVFAGILALLSGVGITNTMMMVVFERRKEIGVLKSQGMKDKQVLNLLCFEGMSMGAIGSMIGIIIGGSIIYYYSKVGIDFGSMMETISSDVNMKSIIYMYYGIDVLLVSFIFGVIVSFLATYVAVRPEVKKEAVENLRNE